MNYKKMTDVRRIERERECVWWVFTPTPSPPLLASPIYFFLYGKKILLLFEIVTNTYRNKENDIKFLTKLRTILCPVRDPIP